MLYSSLKHGSSLNTLLRKVDGHEPVILAIKDFDGYVFGAYLSNGIKHSKQFYGSGETFLFTFQDGECGTISKWTQLNEDFTYCDFDGIAIGCSDKYGLYVNKELSGGYSRACDTFSNE